jgi:ATP-dependent RNA helicase DHX8/PRP22
MQSRTGGIVGYRKGTRGMFGKSTKILYMTDFALLMECIQDSELNQFSCVVIDEAHERSLYTDILLGMLKKLLTKRKELRLIISSATMDTELFRTYFEDFDPTILEISGRTFPVEVIWPSKNWPGLSKCPVLDTVSKVREVHQTEDKGDILVFLTTPAETEKACEYWSQEKELECLPLHGKLQPWEQQRVFQSTSAGKRKVVFATNCAETSITIPGIKYVIDTGLVKENRYDPIKNMSMLDVRKASKSSVEQRKGRAGRIEAGKCFRLFTKDDFDQMETSTKPEILRVQLGHAVLSVMSAGVPDPLQFDFVQSPGSEALKLAMADLVSIGAVEDCHLTDLGRTICKLQLSPRLGKLVTEGIEQDIAIEAMVIASNCTMTGSMFFRLGSDEEKQKADIRKLPFCHPDGDLLTCLDVYRAWVKVPQHQRNRWCMENYINAKAMRIIKETLMELLRILTKQLNIHINCAFKIDHGEANAKIQRCIFSCFKSNLCHYSGHHRIGYLSSQERLRAQTGVLFPSSSLCFLDQKPKWLVYDRILQTSQKFILNVTSIEDSWVKEEIDLGRLDLDLLDIEEKILVPTRMAEFGYLVMKKFMENKYTLCKDLERELATQLQSPVILEVKMAPCALDIIAIKQHHDYIKEAIRNRVEPEKEMIKAENIEVSWNKTTTRLLIGNGYKVNLILGEGDYRRVIIKVKDNVHPAREILEHFEQFGKIIAHFIFSDQNPSKGGRDQSFRWGKITYSSVQEAEDAVQQTEGGAVFALPDLQQGYRKKGNNIEYQIKFRYCRRQSKGAGHVKFTYEEDAIIASVSIPSFKVGNATAVLKHDLRDCTKVNISNIDVATDIPELTEALNEALGTCSASVEEVVLYREKACDAKPSTPDEIKAFRRQLQTAIDEFITPDQKEKYDIRIQQVKPGHIYLQGTIHFKTLNVFEMVANHLSGGQKHLISTMSRPLEVKYHTTISLFVPHAMYNVIKVWFEDIESVKFNECRGVVRINVRCEHTKSLRRVIRLYQEITEGDPIPQDSPVMDFIFTTKGQKWLKNIMKISGTYIAVDRRMKTASIYGTKSAKEIAKDHLYLADVVGEMEKSKGKTIPLQDGTQPKGLMKKLVQTYGSDLEELKRIPCITEATLDFRKRLLKVRGNDAALDIISQRVKDLADEVNGAANDDVDEDITCSVCFNTFEENYKNMYRLQVCGHAYCLDCLETQVRGLLFHSGISF